MKKPLIFAHRGAKGTHPENTMLAFMEGERAGADGIELDVHLSRDGAVIVIHDETVDRTTNGCGTVYEQTLADLQKLDAGRGERIPTLDEVLAWLQQNDLLVNIELKNDVFTYPTLEEKIISLLQHYQLEDRAILSSFNHESIEKLATLAPHIERAILYHEPLQSPLIEAKKRKAQGIHPNFKLLAKQDVEEAQAAGYAVRPYTINEPAHLTKMISYGVDVIITDYPARAKNLIQE